MDKKEFDELRDKIFVKVKEIHDTKGVDYRGGDNSNVTKYFDEIATQSLQFWGGDDFDKEWRREWYALFNKQLKAFQGWVSTGDLKDINENLESRVIDMIGYLIYPVAYEASKQK